MKMAEMEPSLWLRVNPIWVYKGLLLIVNVSEASNVGVFPRLYSNSYCGEVSTIFAK